MADKFTEMYAPPCYITPNGTLANIDNEVRDWVLKNRDKSANFIRGQRGYKSADACMRILMGDEPNESSSRSKLSNLRIKKLRRQGREIVANVSNIRPTWETRTHKEKEFGEEADIRNKLRNWWFYNEFIDRYIKEVSQYAVGAGTGYIWLWPEYDDKTCEIQIKPRVISHRNLYPLHASGDSKISDLYGVTIWLEMPVPEAHEKFPEYIGILLEDRSIPTYFAKGFQKVRRGLKGVYDILMDRKNTEFPDPYPAVDVYYTWVKDNTINETGSSIEIGEPGAPHSYRVPSLFDIAGNPTKKLGNNIVYFGEEGYDNPAARRLKRKECKLFPYRRLIISTNTGVIYDGPPNWITRRPPIAPFKGEELVGEFLGLSLLRDGRGPERSANNMIRTIEDSVVGRLSPPLGISDQLPKPIRQRLAGNVRHLIGKVFAYNVAVLQKAVIPLLPSDYFNIDARAVELVKYMHELSDHLIGTADFTAWQKLRLLPAADTQEHLTQSLGALATDFERSFERSLFELAEIFDDLAPQVYTTPKLITYLGADGISMNNLDYDGNSLIPKPDPNDERSYAQRLMDHNKVFSMYAQPHSIQERMSVTNRLMLAQAAKLGVPISKKRIYDSWFDDGKYEQSKKEFYAEEREKIKLAAELNAELQKIQQMAQPENQLLEEAMNLIKGGNGNEGRPSTDNAPARIEQKMRGGVPDTTIATN